MLRALIAKNLSSIACVLFSMIVPFAKAAMVFVALFLVGDETRRRRLLQFVEAIAKWSMADVFVVALFIAYLAAQASQTPPGDANVPPPLLAFTANFGPGFYWFAAYCIFSLAAQQMTAGWFTRTSSEETP